MTFTVLGRCARNGKTGYAQATSTPAVGWRCTDVVPGYGVLTVQAHGDYRQLQRAKALLQTGQSPEAILDTLRHEDPYFTYRQIALLLNDGRRAVNTGPKARPWAGEIVGEHMIVSGNVLVGPQVLKAMAQAWTRSVDAELEERLLRCVEAGRGGKAGVTSAQKPLVFGCPQLGLVCPMERNGLRHLVAARDEHDSLKTRQVVQLVCG
jgi:uncharacterized Ntn-hydrolase superfamily protein